MLGFSVLKQISDIYLSLGVGLVIGVLFLAAAWFVPVARQFLFGLAIAAFAATWFFGQGVLQERQVCKARQAEAEQARINRDADIAGQAGRDAKRMQAEIDAANQREMETVARYENAIRKNPLCSLTIDDLR